LRCEFSISLRRGQDREGQPRVPSRWPGLRCEFSISLSFETQITLHTADWEQIADLRPDPGNSRLEAGELGAGSAVAGNLVEEITNEPDEDLLRQELRGPQSR
jgi:hypothetical protein